MIKPEENLEHFEKHLPRLVTEEAVRDTVELVREFAVSVAPENYRKLWDSTLRVLKKQDGTVSSGTRRLMALAYMAGECSVGLNFMGALRRGRAKLEAVAGRPKGPPGNGWHRVGTRDRYGRTIEEHKAVYVRDGVVSACEEGPFVGPHARPWNETLHRDSDILLYDWDNAQQLVPGGPSRTWGDEVIPEKRGNDGG